MAKEKLIKRYDGWVYFVQWSNDPATVKIGFASDLADRFGSFFTYSPHHLVVLKAFRANKEEEKDMHVRFDNFRKSGEWFELSPSMIVFLRERARCDTREAKQVIGNAHRERIAWKIMERPLEVKLQEARDANELPSYVTNARVYIIWAISNLLEQDYLCTSAAIIHHPANEDLYEAKTIYNVLPFLITEGLVNKNDKNKQYSLTPKGKRSLTVMWNRSRRRLDNRRSVCSLIGRC